MSLSLHDITVPGDRRSRQHVEVSRSWPRGSYPWWFLSALRVEDQLVAEACSAATESAMGTFFSTKSPLSGLKARVAKYLSTAHRDDPSAGCPLAALGSEIARCDENTRSAATQAFLELVNIIAAESGKTRPNVARRRAVVAAATMIGALTMSRIVTDFELSAAILGEAEKQLVNSR